MKNAENILPNTWTNSNRSEFYEPNSFSFFRKGSCDHLLLFLAMGLAGFGLVMVYSSSYIYAQERYGDGLYFFRRHVAFLFIGLFCMGIIRFIDYRVWRALAFPIFLLSSISMILLFVPGLGNRVGGATRWLNLGFTFIQPIEFAKIALVIFLAKILSKPDLPKNDFYKGFLVLLWPSILLAGLSLLQPDFGSAALIIFTTVMIFYFAGLRFRYLFGGFLLCLPVFYFTIMTVPYRRARFITFLNPWADPQNSGFQIIQSFLAFYRGGLFGAGLGNSKEKLFYLPEAHNDFILAVVGEELGFVGMCLVCAAFLLVFFRSIKIAAKADDFFGALLASGLGVLIGLEAFLNAGIVLGLLPTKGMNMPFISSGGSSILAALIVMGLLLSISTKKTVTDS